MQMMQSLWLVLYHAPLLPRSKPSIGNVIVNGDDLWEDTFYIMLNFNYFYQDLNLCSGTFNMQLCGFHCIPRYSICIILLDLQYQ